MRKLAQKMSATLNRSSSSPDPSSTSSKRRDQIRRAQRTHRERRAKYLENLEAEVKYLRTENSRCMVDLARQEIINDRLQTLLSDNNVSIPPEVHIIDNSELTTKVEVVGAAGEMQHLRVTTTSSSRSSINETPLRYVVNVDDPQTAISFILALEQPCLQHHHQHVGPDGESAHSMMLQASLVNEGPTAVPMAAGTSWPTGSEWNVSTEVLKTQLNTLIRTAQNITFDTEMVPVLCWKRICELHRVSPLSREQLAQLERELVVEVECPQFGAIIDVGAFETVCRRILGRV